ncbi:MAG: hypothetical protein LBG14_02740 [Treponema sp.]|jgi:hypothetical protein|nr:hypothetical protein [Treponema sp.]
MRTWSFFVLIAALASCVSSGTEKAFAGAEEPLMTGTDITRTIRGRVVVFGSEPHTFAGIVAGDGRQYNVTPPEKEEEIRKLQGYEVTFTVIFLDIPAGPPGLALRDGTVELLSWTIEE